MTITDYVPILIQFVLAIVIGVAIIVGSHLFGQRAKGDRIKNTAYECGVVAEGQSPRFSVKFYIVAMLFILFDIEIVFLFPAVLVYREFLQASIPIFLPIFFFLFVLVIGLLYEMKKGALVWER